MINQTQTLANRTITIVEPVRGSGKNVDGLQSFPGMRGKFRRRGRSTRLSAFTGFAIRFQ